MRNKNHHLGDKFCSSYWCALSLQRQGFYMHSEIWETKFIPYIFIKELLNPAPPKAFDPPRKIGNIIFYFILNEK